MALFLAYVNTAPMMGAVLFGVTVTFDIPVGTDSVYTMIEEEKGGMSTPIDALRAERVGSFD